MYKHHYLLCACVLAMKQKYSAASLCSITTEVLKVLNATEELIGEAGGESRTPSESMSASPITSGCGTRRLDQKLTKMEEKVNDKASCLGSNVKPTRLCAGLPHCWGCVRTGGDSGRLGALRPQHQQRHHGHRTGLPGGPGGCCSSTCSAV